MNQTFTPTQLFTEVGTPVNLSPAAQPLVAAQRFVPAQTISDQDIEKLGDNYAMQLSGLSKKMLSSVRASDVDAFGEKLNALVGVAKELDPSKFKTKGIIASIQRMFGSAKEKMLAQYQSVEQRMNVLVGELDKSAQLQIQRVSDLEEMYAANLASHDGLGQAEEQGKQILVVMEKQLEEMTEQAKSAPADTFTAQHLADYQAKMLRLEKRVDDLGRAKYLAKLSAPQIRIMQDNARTLAEKFNDIKVTTIPAWQNTFSMYLVQLEQQKGAQLANAVHDATDDAFKLQADLLRQNTQEITKAKQRSVVTIETLQHMQKQLMGAMDDMTRINDEGRRTRKDAVPKMQALEQELITRFTPKTSA